MVCKRDRQIGKDSTLDELIGELDTDGSTEIDITKIRSFKDHPFKIVDDDKMHELVESIMKNGVLKPVIVREIGNSEYEMISGHRRLFATKQVGLEKIPAFVKKMTDVEAVLVMVDSNLQREEILPSEKAFAYKMRYEAMRKQDKELEGTTSSHSGKKSLEGAADVVLAKCVGESRNQIHRYMRLTEVIPDILNLVDNKILPLMVAVEISYLSEILQKWIYDYMRENGVCKTYQIYAVRDYLNDNEGITRMGLIKILNENLPEDESNRFQRIIITKSKLQEYFPPFYTRKQMENVLFKLLEQWRKETERKGYDK